MKKFIAMLLALVLALTLVSCGKEEAPDAEGTKDKVVFQLPGEPDNLDLQTNGAMMDGYLVDQIYGKLVRFDENSNVVGELAESWDWNDDFTQLTFHLRDGIKFSDGTDITSEDFIYTYSTDAAKSNTYLSPIESMEAPDAKTLVLNLKESNSSQLKYMTTYHTGVLPKGSMEALDINKGATAYSGSYYLESWEMGQNLIMKANPYWYDAANVAIQEVEFSFIADENSALVALEAGEIDFMYGSNGLSPSVYESVESTDGLNAVFAAQADVGMILMNFTMPEMNDLNVRHAIDCAIDREAITKVSVIGEALGNVFTADYFGDDYVSGHDARPLDLEKAKEYMAKSAYPDGFTVELMTPTMYTKAATIVQSELAEIGITVEVKEVDASVWVSEIIAGNYQMGFMTFANLINDMTGFISMYTMGNALHFNQDTDTVPYDLLKKAQTLDGAERTAVLTEFAEYSEENLPYIGLFVRNAVWAQNSSLSLAAPTASGFELDSMHW